MRTEDVLLNLASGTGQQLSQWPRSASIRCPTIVSGVHFSQTWSFVEKDRKMGGGAGLKEDIGSTIICLSFIIMLGHYGMFLW